jgi:hypothetical protein
MQACGQDRTLGHMNEATSRRYRHLYPSTQKEAIKGVFA